MRCATCKHWDAPTASWQDGLGKCRLISSDDAWETVVVYDLNREETALHTAAGFGCVLHEPKEAAEPKSLEALAADALEEHAEQTRAFREMVFKLPPEEAE